MGPTYSGINQEEGRAEEAGWPEEAGEGVSPTSGYREREDALPSLGAIEGSWEHRSVLQGLARLGDRDYHIETG